MSQQTDNDQWHERITTLLQDVVLAVNVLRRDMDAIKHRLERLEQDRAAMPDWQIDEGE